jgi:tripartite ATP-independent transporter DctM subunit
MLVAGVLGSYLVTDSWLPILSKMKNETYSTFSSYSLSIVPLFLLMGQFATLGGMSQALFNSAEKWVGHKRGGVAMAAIGACAGFGSICGSSLATAATMSQVALPELRRHGYSGQLATGTLAAGGTLGILIPPSFVLVIYAILTEQNIAKLFVVAFIPGLLAALGYMIAISIYVRLFPETAGSRERAPYSERFRSLIEVWPVVVIFLAVVGGIYSGWFTPTEGAAVGAAGTGLLALINGGLTWKTLVSCLLSTASATAMIFFIVFGASIYNGFLALSQVPVELANWVVELGLNPWAVLVLILLVYLVLGCVMDSLSMILLTIPIFFPIVSALDYGLGAEEFALWFGIIVLIVVEVGLITPPVGMNLFVINSMAKETPLSATFRGVVPFILSDLIRTAILVMFPSITLVLLRMLY